MDDITMKRIICLSCILLFLLPGCKKPKTVDYENVLLTLSEYEGAIYRLTSITWGGDNSICLTENLTARGKDLLNQLVLLPDYQSVMTFSKRKESSFSQALKQQDNTWKGSLEIVQGITEYEVDSEQQESPKPSETFSFGMRTFYISIPYYIDEDGSITTEDYVAKKKDSYWAQSTHLDCHIETLSKEKIVVVFPDYLVPDYITDQFYTGPVTMEFLRN